MGYLERLVEQLVSVPTDAARTVCLNHIDDFLARSRAAAGCAANAPAPDALLRDVYKAGLFHAVVRVAAAVPCSGAFVAAARKALQRLASPRVWELVAGLLQAVLARPRGGSSGPAPGVSDVFGASAASLGASVYSLGGAGNAVLPHQYETDAQLLLLLGAAMDAAAAAASVAGQTAASSAADTAAASAGGTPPLVADALRFLTGYVVDHLGAERAAQQRRAAGLAAAATAPATATAASTGGGGGPSRKQSQSQPNDARPVPRGAWIASAAGSGGSNPSTPEMPLVLQSVRALVSPSPTGIGARSETPPSHGGGGPGSIFPGRLRGNSGANHNNGGGGEIPGSSQSPARMPQVPRLALGPKNGSGNINAQGGGGGPTALVRQQWSRQSIDAAPLQELVAMMKALPSPSAADGRSPIVAGFMWTPQSLSGRGGPVLGSPAAATNVSPPLQPVSLPESAFLAANAVSAAGCMSSPRQLRSGLPALRALLACGHKAGQLYATMDVTTLLALKKDQEAVLLAHTGPNVPSRLFCATPMSPSGLDSSMTLPSFGVPSAAAGGSPARGESFNPSGRDTEIVVTSPGSPGRGLAAGPAGAMAPMFAAAATTDLSTGYGGGVAGGGAASEGAGATATTTAAPAGGVGAWAAARRASALKTFFAAALDEIGPMPSPPRGERRSATTASVETESMSDSTANAIGACTLSDATSLVTGLGALSSRGNESGSGANWGGGSAHGCRARAFRIVLRFFALAASRYGAALHPLANAVSVTLSHEIHASLDCGDARHLGALCGVLRGYSIGVDAAYFRMLQQPVPLVGVPLDVVATALRSPVDVFLRQWASVAAFLLSQTQRSSPAPSPVARPRESLFAADFLAPQNAASAAASGPQVPLSTWAGRLQWHLAVLAHYTDGLAGSSRALPLLTASGCIEILVDMADAARRDVSFTPFFATTLHYILEIFDSIAASPLLPPVLLRVLYEVFVPNSDTSTAGGLALVLRPYVARVLVEAESPWAAFGLEPPAPMSSRQPSSSQTHKDRRHHHNSGAGTVLEMEGLVPRSTVFWPDAFDATLHAVRLLRHAAVILRLPLVPGVECGALLGSASGGNKNGNPNANSGHNLNSFTESTSVPMFQRQRPRRSPGEGRRYSLRISEPIDASVEHLLNPFDGVALSLLTRAGDENAWAFPLAFESLRLVRHACYETTVFARQAQWGNTYIRFLYLSFLQHYHGDRFVLGDGVALHLTTQTLRTLSAIVDTCPAARLKALQLGIVSTLVREVDLEQSSKTLRDRHLRRVSSAAVVGPGEFGKPPPQQQAQHHQPPPQQHQQHQPHSQQPSPSGSNHHPPTGLDAQGRASPRGAHGQSLHSDSHPTLMQFQHHASSGSLSPRFPYPSAVSHSHSTSSRVAAMHDSISETPLVIPLISYGSVAAGGAGGGGGSDVGAGVAVSGCAAVVAGSHAGSASSVAMTPPTTPAGLEIASPRPAPAIPTMPASAVVSAGPTTTATATPVVTMVATGGPPPRRPMIPKLSLAAAPPPMYFTSNGDTGGAAEAQFMMVGRPDGPTPLPTPLPTPAPSPSFPPPPVQPQLTPPMLQGPSRSPSPPLLSSTGGPQERPSIAGNTPTVSICLEPERAAAVPNPGGETAAPSPTAEVGPRRSPPVSAVRVGSSIMIKKLPTHQLPPTTDGVVVVASGSFLSSAEGSIVTTSAPVVAGGGGGGGGGRPRHTGIGRRYGTEEDIFNSVRQTSFRVPEGSFLVDRATYPTELLHDETRFTAHQRATRRIYSHLPLQVEVLHFLLLLLVRPDGRLDPHYLDSYTLCSKKINILFYVEAHLNHDSNRAVIAPLARRVSASQSVGMLVLHRLLCKRPQAQVLHGVGSRIGHGAYGVVMESPTTLASGQARHSHASLMSSVSSFLPTAVCVPGAAVKLIPVPRHIDDRANIVTLHTEVMLMLSNQDSGGVCELLDFGHDGSAYRVVMRRYDKSLRQWRDEIARAQEAVAAEGGPSVVVQNAAMFPVYLTLFLDVLGAVQSLHTRGVVHYDLKCDNVMLYERRGAFGSALGVRLVDFGESETVEPQGGNVAELGMSVGDSAVLGGAGLTAAMYRRSQRLANQSKGTEIIRAPELLLPHKYADRRRRPHMLAFQADVWSLGCLLYELVTGKHLFQEDAYMKLVHRVASDEGAIMEDEHRARLGNDPNICALLLFLLCRDPQCRPLVPEARARVAVCMEKCGWSRSYPELWRPPSVSVASLGSTLISPLGGSSVSMNAVSVNGVHVAALPVVIAVPGPAMHAASSSAAVLPGSPVSRISSPAATPRSTSMSTLPAPADDITRLLRPSCVARVIGITPPPALTTTTTNNSTTNGNTTGSGREGSVLVAAAAAHSVPPSALPRPMSMERQPSENDEEPHPLLSTVKYHSAGFAPENGAGDNDADTGVTTATSATPRVSGGVGVAAQSPRPQHNSKRTSGVDDSLNVTMNNATAAANMTGTTSTNETGEDSDGDVSDGEGEDQCDDVRPLLPHILHSALAPPVGSTEFCSTLGSGGLIGATPATRRAPRPPSVDALYRLGCTHLVSFTVNDGGRTAAASQHFHTFSLGLLLQAYAQFVGDGHGNFPGVASTMHPLPPSFNCTAVNTPTIPVVDGRDGSFPPGGGEGTGTAATAAAAVNGQAADTASTSGISTAAAAARSAAVVTALANAFVVRAVSFMQRATAMNGRCVLQGCVLDDGVDLALVLALCYVVQTYGVPLVVAHAHVSAVGQYDAADGVSTERCVHVAAAFLRHADARLPTGESVVVYEAPVVSALRAGLRPSVVQLIKDHHAAQRAHGRLHSGGSGGSNGGSGARPVLCTCICGQVVYEVEPTHVAQSALALTQSGRGGAAAGAGTLGSKSAFSAGPVRLIVFDRRKGDAVNADVVSRDTIAALYTRLQALYGSHVTQWCFRDDMLLLCTVRARFVPDAPFAPVNLLRLRAGSHAASSNAASASDASDGGNPPSPAELEEAAGLRGGWVRRGLEWACRHCGYPTHWEAENSALSFTVHCSLPLRGPDPVAMFPPPQQGVPQQGAGAAAGATTTGRERTGLGTVSSVGSGLFRGSSTDRSGVSTPCTTAMQAVPVSHNGASHQATMHDEDILEGLFAEVQEASSSPPLQSSANDVGGSRGRGLLAGLVPSGDDDPRARVWYRRLFMRPPAWRDAFAD